MSRRRAKKRASSSVHTTSSPGPASSLRLPHGDPVPRLERHRPRGAGRGGPAWRKHLGVKVTRDTGSYGPLGFGPKASVGYRARRVADAEGRAPSRSGQRVHERVDRLALQYMSRDFARDNGIYRGMILRAVSYIVGRGFALMPRTKSRSWNKNTYARWKKFWKRPEITGQISGARFESMVMQEVLLCGETAVIPTTNRKGEDTLQPIEAEQIIGKDWLAQGIERDWETGEPLKFWVSPYNRDGYPQRGKAVAYSPETFFYISSPERPSSNRAVPPCQSSFSMLHRINDVCDSEAIAWQMQAKIALISNKESGAQILGAVQAAPSPHAGSDTDEGGLTTGGGDPTEDQITILDTAIMVHGKPGETLSGMERTAPGSKFSESITMFFRLLGLPLGLPLELLLLDWTKSNYSQSRAVLEQAYTSFLEWQDLLVDLFHDRVYEWWLLREIERGEIKERPDQIEHEWIRPTFPWIDQLQEAQAQGEKLDRGFESHTGVLKSLNKDREHMLDLLEEETLDAIEISQWIKEKTGVEVPWERFCGQKAGTAKPSKPGASPEEDSSDGATDDEADQGEGAPDKKKDKDKKKPAARSIAPRPKFRRVRASVRRRSARREVTT